jgi:hypothetical protein
LQVILISLNAVEFPLSFEIVKIQIKPSKAASEVRAVIFAHNQKGISGRKTIRETKRGADGCKQADLQTCWQLNAL